MKRAQAAVLILIALILTVALAPLLAFATQIYEGNYVTSNSAWTVYGTTQRAENFTVGTFAHTLTFLEVRISRSASGPANTTTFSIRATDANGQPTGSDLAYNTSTTFGLAPGNTAWVNLTMNTNIILNGNTVYAIIMKAPDNTFAGGYIGWYYNNTNPYSGGMELQSGDSGVTWYKAVNDDLLFRIWGEPLTPVFNTPGVTSTIVTSSTKLYSYWIQGNSTMQLSGYIFTWNDSTTYVNDSWVGFSDPTAAWANVTHTITATAGNNVTWFLYVNCTDMTNYTMPVQTFTVMTTVLLILNQPTYGDLLYNGTWVANNTLLTYSVATVLRLEALPASASYLFVNFSWAAGSSLSNRYNFTVSLTQPTVMWVYFNLTSDIYAAGYAAGYAVGYAAGWIAGNVSGWVDGNLSGWISGNNTGWLAGNATGWIAGNSSGWTSGNATGYTTGYSAGYSVGYSTGFSDGVASVVIPDYSIARFDFVISNFTVSFNASQSYSTVAILNYTWNFGDGNVTTLAGDLVDHTFATNSTYAVTLTLGSSASNNSAVVFHDVVVGLEAPSTDDTGFYIAGGFFFAIVILVIAIALSKR